MSEPNLEQELEELGTQLTTRQLIITVDVKGEPLMDAGDFSDWEVFGLARWIVAQAELLFDDED